jgi:DHA3 family macrolide efflux protein-like MFS transporter
MVPEDKLTKVNAVNGSVQSVIMLISPMVSGFLLTITTIEITFFIDVVTAAIAVSILFFMKIPLHAKALEKQVGNYFKDLKEGYLYIKEHSFIKVICLFSIVFFILITPVAFLSSLHVSRIFGNDVWRLSTLEIFFSGGMTLGGFIMFFWKGFKNKNYTMTFSNFIIAVFTTAIGITPIFWLYMVFIGFIGFSMPIFNTPFNVLLQEKVEENYMGRVFSVFGMIQRITMPLGMLFFGPLSDYVKIEYLFIITGILMIILSFFMLSNKVLIEAGKPKLDK